MGRSKESFDKAILIGAWTLNKHGRFNAKGDYMPSGSDISGQLTYTAEGYMTVFITLTHEPVQFSEIIIYSGRYSFLPEKIIHHIENSPNPKRRGTDETRLYEISQDLLIFRTEKSDAGHYEIVWKKRTHQTN